jgi:hypothetical protein
MLDRKAISKSQITTDTGPPLRSVFLAIGKPPEPNLIFLSLDWNLISSNVGLSQTENPKEFTTVTILMVKSLVSQEFS